MEKKQSRTNVKKLTLQFAICDQINSTVSKLFDVFSTFPYRNKYTFLLGRATILRTKLGRSSRYVPVSTNNPVSVPFFVRSYTDMSP